MTKQLAADGDHLLMGVTMKKQRRHVLARDEPIPRRDGALRHHATEPDLRIVQLPGVEQSRTPRQFLESQGDDRRGLRSFVGVFR